MTVELTIDIFLVTCGTWGNILVTFNTNSCWGTSVIANCTNYFPRKQ